MAITIKDGTGAAQTLTSTVVSAAHLPHHVITKADGTVVNPLTDTELRATPVPISGTVVIGDGSGTIDVNDGGGSLTVDGTVSISGTVTVADASLAAATMAKYLSAASTNATSVKASAGTLRGFTIINTTATVYYFKLYNKASAPTVGTDTPVWTMAVPANASGAGVNVWPPGGLAFSTGIAFALTSGSADGDTGAAATGITLSLAYV